MKPIQLYSTRTAALLVPALALLGAVGCGRGDKDGAGYPEDFGQRSDQQKLEFVMENSKPDSVARFICYSTIGRNKGVGIDNLPLALAYVYDSYTGEDLTLFSEELDNLRHTLPLRDTYRLNLKSGELDSISLGYDLGLSYVRKVRDNNMTVEQIDKELAGLKEECGSDAATYQRFMTGFKTALTVDRGKDLPEAVYQRYSK